MTNPKDFYAVLGVAPGATKGEIRQAYRRLARRFHPDVSTDPEGEERFKEINAAYEILSDPDLRQEYDRERGSPFVWRPPPPAPPPAPAVPRKPKITKITKIPLPDVYMFLAMAVYLADRDKGTSFVVVSPYSAIDSTRSIQYPIWRVTNEEGNIVIEAAPALVEGSHAHTHELSPKFKWHKIDTRHTSSVFTPEESELVYLVRTLALDPGRAWQDVGKLGRIKTLAQKVQSERKYCWSAKEYNIEDFERFLTGPYFNVSPEGARITMTKPELALVAILTKWYESRLPCDQVLVVMRGKESTLHLVVDTREGKINISATKNHPLYGNARAFNKYLSALSNLARRYAEDNIASGELSQSVNSVLRDSFSPDYLGAEARGCIIHHDEYSPSLAMRDEFSRLSGVGRAYEGRIARVVETKKGLFTPRRDKRFLDDMIARLVKEGDFAGIAFGYPLPLKEVGRYGSNPEAEC